MPYTLPIREGYPQQFETLQKVGTYVQGAVRIVDYYNTTGKTIVPGEPIVVFGHIGITVEAVPPGVFCSVYIGAEVDFLVDPALAAVIKQNDPVYFDLGLKNDSIYVPGYATGVLPTNGYKLGVALGIYEGPMGPKPLSGTKLIAAKVGARRVRVLMDLAAPTTYGTVQDWDGT